MKKQFQLNHYEFKERQIKHKNNIIYVLENLEHLENIGSAFRLADAFNIEKIFIITKNDLDFKKIEKTARNCDKNVEYKIFDNINNVLEELNKLNYSPINLEITSTSLPLRQYDFKKINKCAIIVGNERNGVSDEMLSKVKNSMHIEMYGNNSSMNIATSLAIATYEISEQNFKE